jgi:hypothetical protein
LIRLWWGVLHARRWRLVGRRFGGILVVSNRVMIVVVAV